MEVHKYILVGSDNHSLLGLAPGSYTDLLDPEQSKLVASKPSLQVNSCNCHY